MNSISRRKFLKISGATIGAAVLSGSMSSFVKGADNKINKKDIKGIQKIPTYCAMCFWRCGAIAHVKDGKLWKIEGNPDDPLSKGRLCPRGTGGVGTHYDPDRLRSPLIRKNIRGEEQWVEVTWNEALDYVAKRMIDIKKTYGPESMAMFHHGIGATFLEHMMKSYGAINFGAPSFAQCKGPRDVAFNLTFGETVGGPERTDIENAKCIVLIGSHIGENMHNTQVQEFSKAVANHASIIVVDPRFSVAASKAKYYLPIKPGTDIALLLAWMNVIVNEKLYDNEYINKYGFGFEQFVAQLTSYTPEWAYPETGIEPDVIRKTAREMARYKPATLVHPGRHSTWYGDDTQRSRALALLNALLGSWGRKGGLYQPTWLDIPAYPYPDYPKSNKKKLDNPDEKYPFAIEEITTGVREATITGKPYPIKGWFVYGTNLPYSLPQPDKTIEAIKNLEFLVVVDTIGSEIAGWADVVLPESVYLERYDELNNPSFKVPYVGIRQPVVDPPGDQKPNYWIAKKLATRLGLDKYFPWKDIEEYLDYRLQKVGLSLELMKEKGIFLAPEQPIYYEDGVKPYFGTPSGKIEFYSLQLEQKGFDPVPKYTKPEEPPAGYFRLLYGRAPVHTFSRTQTNRILDDMMDTNKVWINKDVADHYGIRNGSFIKLKNQDGVISNKVKAFVTERIRTDCVYMVHGFGHTSKMLKGTYMKGADDSRLITQVKTDPIMGGTGMRVNFVTFELEA
ncbi:MAG TPA: molybdopterin-dependent oxidoreductase [Balneolales bacterium]|nr:molybdopterin-dependent oxidoreductase [Balneolales bacterium]